MIENVYEYLCYRDPRNPHYLDRDALGLDDNEPLPTPRLDCSCDNCFYGHNALAERIIGLEEEVERLEGYLN